MSNQAIDIYCDESRHDLLTTSHARTGYMLIGSVWLETQSRQLFKNELHEIRERHKYGGEAKWQKISPSRTGFFLDLIDWFFEKNRDMRFRCIEVDASKVDLACFHDDDAELGFYKFYYQLLNHWLESEHTYNVFCDYKRDRESNRLAVLQRCLSYGLPPNAINQVKTVQSGESVLLQLADILTGAASAKANGAVRKGGAKAAVIERIERHLGRPIAPTTKGTRKFNVFRIRL